MCIIFKMKVLSEVSKIISILFNFGTIKKNIFQPDDRLPYRMDTTIPVSNSRNRVERIETEVTVELLVN